MDQVPSPRIKGLILMASASSSPRFRRGILLVAGSIVLLAGLWSFLCGPAGVQLPLAAVPGPGAPEGAAPPDAAGHAVHGAPGGHALPDESQGPFPMPP